MFFCCCAIAHFGESVDCGESTAGKITSAFNRYRQDHMQCLRVLRGERGCRGGGCTEKVWAFEEFREKWCYCCCCKIGEGGKRGIAIVLCSVGKI